MTSDSLRTISYFTVWGLFYGALLGTFSGTAILPMFGTMYAMIWGPGVGLACGLLSGLIMGVVHATSFTRDTNLDTFRRRASLGIGLLIAAAAPLILLATTRGVLWQDSGLMRDMAYYTGFSLFGAAFWGALSAAYTASLYPHFIARVMARREDSEDEMGLMPQHHEVINASIRMLRKGLNKWVFMLGTGAALVNTLSLAPYRLSNFDLITYFISGILLGVIGTFVVGIYLSVGNAALLTILKRVVFREYMAHLPPQTTRRILTVTAFFFTLGTTYWTAFLSPVITLVMAALVYHSIALPDDSFDKAKRKEAKAKNALALEEMAEDDHMAIPPLSHESLSRETR